MARDITRGLNNCPGRDRADSDTGEEGREKEVVPRRNDDNVIVVGVESFQEACSGPTTAEDDDSFL